MPQQASHWLHWSWWRRQHQATAAACHRQRRQRTRVVGVRSAEAPPPHPYAAAPPGTATHHTVAAHLWERLEPLLPRPRGKQPNVDRRAVLDAILYVLQTDCGWIHLPSRFPPWELVRKQYDRWCRMGIWDRIWDGLALPPPRQRE
jgi:Putative transposase of IS4/5 family (DUF4096)